MTSGMADIINNKEYNIQVVSERQCNCCQCYKNVWLTTQNSDETASPTVTIKPSSWMSSAISVTRKNGQH
jgi:hypothetical protein